MKDTSYYTYVFVRPSPHPSTLDYELLKGKDDDLLLCTTQEAPESREMITNLLLLLVDAKYVDLFYSGRPLSKKYKNIFHKME